MLGLLRHITVSALLGGGIGAVAALLAAEVSLQSAAGGAIIGLAIGASISLRIALHRRST